MPSVHELTDLHSHGLIRPVAGPSVCRRCFNLTDGYPVCFACSRTPAHLDALLPISYSVAHGQLHRVLAGYKRLHGEAARRLQLGVAAILWRFLEEHEACLAAAAGVPGFDLVTTVPSGDRAREATHPLPRLVRDVVAPTRSRYAPLLVRTDCPVGERAFSPGKFAATRELAGGHVLLIDDTWTTGASAQSAAAALRAAGSGRVAAVVVGRHLNGEWTGNRERLARLRGPFSWDECCLECASAAARWAA